MRTPSASPPRGCSSPRPFDEAMAPGDDDARCRWPRDHVKRYPVCMCDNLSSQRRSRAIDYRLRRQSDSDGQSGCQDVSERAKRRFSFQSSALSLWLSTGKVGVSCGAKPQSDSVFLFESRARHHVRAKRRTREMRKGKSSIPVSRASAVTSRGRHRPSARSWLR